MFAILWQLKLLLASEGWAASIQLHEYLVFISVITAIYGANVNLFVFLLFQRGGYGRGRPDPSQQE